jgi:hypothetical protein
MKLILTATLLAALSGLSIVTRADDAVSPFAPRVLPPIPVTDPEMNCRAENARVQASSELPCTALTWLPSWSHETYLLCHPRDKALQPCIPYRLHALD